MSIEFSFPFDTWFVRAKKFLLSGRSGGRLGGRAVCPLSGTQAKSQQIAKLRYVRAPLSV